MPFLVLGQLGMILKFECVHDVNSYTYVWCLIILDERTIYHHLQWF